MIRPLIPSSSRNDAGRLPDERDHLRHRPRLPEQPGAQSSSLRGRTLPDRMPDQQRFRLGKVGPRTCRNDGHAYVFNLDIELSCYSTKEKWVVGKMTKNVYVHYYYDMQEASSARQDLSVKIHQTLNALNKGEKIPDTLMKQVRPFIKRYPTPTATSTRRRKCTGSSWMKR